MGRACGEPDETKENTHPKYITVLRREQDYEFEFGNAFKLSQAKGTYQACKVLGPPGKRLA